MSRKSMNHVAASLALAVLVTGVSVGCAGGSKKPQDPQAMAAAKEQAAERARAQRQREQLARERHMQRQQVARDVTAMKAQQKQLHAAASVNVAKAGQLRAEAKVLEADGQTIMLAGAAMTETGDLDRGDRTTARGQPKVDAAAAMRARADGLEQDSARMLADAAALDAKAREAIASLPRD